jgi:uncharacterized lipoprotein YddW (UPF0748 family)
MFFIALFCFQLSANEDFNTYLWVQIESLSTHKSIENVIEFASLNSYDNLLVQVRSRDNAAYNSSFIDKPYFISSDFDPLAYITKLAHSKNIKIHAWINMYVIWSGKKDPSNKNHIFNKNKSWNDYSFSNHSGSFTNHYLSPLHPQVNPYLVSIIKEVCDKYSIDGIHLDYVRFKDIDYGNNKEGLKIFDNDQNFKNMSDIENEKLKKYKIENVTSLVKDAYTLVKGYNSKLVLSIAVKSNILEAKNRFSQDWLSWIKSGIVDMVFPMNYYKEMEYFNRDLKLMLKRIPEPLHSKVILGLGCYNQSAEDVVDKISLVKLHKFGGVSFFSFDNHINDLSWFDPLHKRLFLN